MKDSPSPGDFVRGLAHDLTNPLSSVLGFLDLLLSPDAKDSLTHRQRRMLAAMDRACTHLLGIIRDLSELSKIDEAAEEAPPSPVDLTAAAGKTFEQYRLLASHRRIGLTLESPAGLPRVLANPARIDSFLDALMRAAGRRTTEGGFIVLRLAGKGGAVEGVLEHSGEEIAPDSLSPALSATLSGPRPMDGYASLGLALAGRIARLHGGELDAAPRAEGGARFRFRFPVAP